MSVKHFIYNIIIWVCDVTVTCLWHGVLELLQCSYDRAQPLLPHARQEMVEPVLYGVPLWRF